MKITNYWPMIIDAFRRNGSLRSQRWMIVRVVFLPGIHRNIYVGGQIKTEIGAFGFGVEF